MTDQTFTASIGGIGVFSFNSTEDWQKKWEEQRQLNKKELEEELFFLKEDLKEQGIAEVEIDFFGGGDEGSISDILYKNDKGDETSIDRLTDNRIENYAYKFLETTGVDWFNDTGGQGTIVLDINNEISGCRIEQNETVAHEVYREVKGI